MSARLTSATRMRLRRRRDPWGLLGRAGRALPELDHRYPTFQFDIAWAGSPAATGSCAITLTAEVADLARGAVVFAPSASAGTSTTS